MVSMVEQQDEPEWQEKEEQELHHESVLGPSEVAVQGQADADNDGGDDDDIIIPAGMPTRFSFQEITTMTSNFATKVRTGGFGTVYKGELPMARRGAHRREKARGYRAEGKKTGENGKTEGWIETYDSGMILIL
uniref:Protein kinase domain-containing protein n=1 Tax=Oryza rufipogon TaxID=4529 RepID=A0A0E0PQS0_ORYRU